MSAGALTPDNLQPRPADGLLPGAGLAVVVHVGLIAALALGVNWRHTSETVYSAELWAALPEVAAPRAVRPEPAPPPPPPPPTPAPRPAPAPAPAPPPAPSAVDIAIEREKQLQAERAAQRERERLAEARRAREAEQAALRQQRELQQKRQQELARAAEEARQQALLDKQRKENLDRMLAQAGGTGPTQSTGSAARDAAPSNAYAGLLIRHIKSQIVMPDLDRLPPSLAAEVEVRATASGTVLSSRLLKPSGNKAWDEAVLRAIDRSGTLPRDTDGRVPPTINITFRPTD